MRRVLGRGLSQLVSEHYDAPTNELPVEDIEPNIRQPRSSFNEETLQELAESIKVFGVLQPIVVRPLENDKYEVIAGERRLRAAKLAGLQSIPVVVRSVGGQTSLELALIENLQRDDIGPLESARAYRRLIDEFGITQEAVATRVGKSRAVVANSIRLLRLPKQITDGLESGAISEGHARALLAFENEAHQLAVYDQILARSLTVRDVEKATRAKDSAGTQKASARPARNHPEDDAIMESLSAYIGSPAKIQRSGPGGKLVVDFYCDDDLERILDVIGFEL